MEILLQQPSEVFLFLFQLNRGSKSLSHFRGKDLFWGLWVEHGDGLIFILFVSSNFVTFLMFPCNSTLFYLKD